MKGRQELKKKFAFCRSQNKIPEVAVKPAHGLRASKKRG